MKLAHPMKQARWLMPVLMTVLCVKATAGDPELIESVKARDIEATRQLIGAGATIVWCGGISFILLKGIDAVVGLRVSDEEETEGLDLVLHDERGYNL